MKENFPVETRTKYMSGDVTPKVKATIRRLRLDFGAELHVKNDNSAIHYVVGS